MSRRKRGEVRKQILRILKEEGSLYFGQLKKKIEEESDEGLPKLSNRVLSYNLKKLKEKNKVRKRKGKWDLTEKYLETETHEKIGEILGNEPVSSFGRDRLTPSFKFSKRGSETGEYLLEPRGWDRRLDQLVNMHFATEVWRLLGERGARERKKILKECATALWNGLVFRVKEGRESTLKVYKRIEPNIRGVLKKVIKTKNLRAEETWKVPRLEENLAMAMKEGLWLATHGGENQKAEGMELEPLTNQQVRHMCLSLTALFLGAQRLSEAPDLKPVMGMKMIPDHPPAENPEETIECRPDLVREAGKILGDVSKNLKDGKNPQTGGGPLHDFLKEVRGIKFSFFCSVGWDSLERKVHPLRFKVRKTVDEWRETLREKIPKIRKKDLDTLLGNIENTIYRLESSKPLKPKPNKLPLGRNITFKDIYKHHPGAKDVDWWKGWKKEVEEYIQEDLFRP